MKIGVGRLSIFILTLLPLTSWACSCPFFYPPKTRQDVICSANRISPNIYKATVTSAYCKCFPPSLGVFSCINLYTNSSGSVIGGVEGAYQCQEGGPAHQYFYYYQECHTVIQKGGSAFSSIINGSVPMENITCNYRPYYNDDGGCSITQQPCYYTLMVDTMYKGNLYKAGQSFNTSGPDVLTTCGQYGRVLTVGESYIIGVGSTCLSISPWSSFDSYSLSEIQLLRNSTNCSASKSMTMSTVLVTSATSPFQTPIKQGGLSEKQIIIITVTTPIGIILIIIIVGLVITGICIGIILTIRRKTRRSTDLRVTRKNSITQKALLSNNEDNDIISSTDTNGDNQLVT